MFTWKKDLKACSSQDVWNEAVKEKLLCFLSHTAICYRATGLGACGSILSEKSQTIVYQYKILIFCSAVALGGQCRCALCRVKGGLALVCLCAAAFLWSGAALACPPARAALHTAPPIYKSGSPTDLTLPEVVVGEPDYPFMHQITK